MCPLRNAQKILLSHGRLFLDYIKSFQMLVNPAQIFRSQTFPDPKQTKNGAGLIT